jgi:gliding motility-associated-like protein
MDYTILVTLPDGCTDTLDLHVNTRTESFDAGPDLNVCAGQSIAIGITDSTNEFSYVWTPGNILNDSTLANPLATLENSTQFTVFRIPNETSENCPGEGVRTINVVAKPLAAFSTQIDLGCDGVSVSIIDSASGFTELIYEVNSEVVPANSIQQIEFPYSDSLTILQVAINGECRDTLSFTTYINALESYYDENSSNVFSPNNDGLNDCFSPALSLKDNVLVTDFLPCSDLYVYDRWGRLVYASLEVESTACWDGNTKAGNPCDEGVYYFVYRFKGDEKAGIVHLRR